MTAHSTFLTLCNSWRHLQVEGGRLPAKFIHLLRDNRLLSVSRGIQALVYQRDKCDRFSQRGSNVSSQTHRGSLHIRSNHFY